jgi:CRP-like cAMP-binding protein
MTIEDDISFLGRVPTFAQLGFSALQIVAIGSETRHLEDGEILFRAGETTDAGYVIQEGSLKLTTHDPKRFDPSVTFGPGALIEPTTVIRISRSLFRKVLEGFPDAARLIRDRFTERANLASNELFRLRGMLEKPSPSLNLTRGS